jgi:HSP20 family protein
MRRDDDDPFDEFFSEIERMMDEMMGPEGDVHIDRSPDDSPDLHVDIHETDEEIRVVADIPGIEKDAIDLKCDGTALTIDAGRYSERLTLPTRVDEHSAAATYNNGILEVTFERAEDSADIEL